MRLLEELTEKESRLAQRADQAGKEYTMAAIELKAVRQAIAYLSNPKREKTGVNKMKRIPGIRWNEEKLKQAADWRSSGVPHKEIGARLGTSEAAVWQALYSLRKVNKEQENKVG